jgi:DNA-directed RNA polymerase subunit M/transcription elongation factor TFIIS
MTDTKDQRIAELERERDALAAGLDRDTRSRYQLIDRLNALERALRPFGEGGPAEAIEREDFSVMRERICDWFGPSDFRNARAALTDQPNRERAAQIAEDIGDVETAAEVRGRDDQPAQDGGHPSEDDIQAAVCAVEQALAEGLIRGDDEVTHRLVDIIAQQRADARNLQPDQPAGYSLEPLQHKPLNEDARKRGQDALRRLSGKDQPAQDDHGIRIVDTGHGYIVKVHSETYEVHRTLHDAKKGWNRAAMAYPNAPRHIGIYRETPADQPADAGEDENEDKLGTCPHCHEEDALMEVLEDDNTPSGFYVCDACGREPADSPTCQRKEHRND